ncbi:DUF1613-domain-containing protein, partial [Amniculicola lignicola CBS 123094]
MSIMASNNESGSENSHDAISPAAEPKVTEPARAISTSSKVHKELPTPPSIKFEPYNLEDAHTPTINSGLPDEIWTIVQSAPATFPPQFFLDVSRNLVENPNITASHLSRAEIPYSSFTDATYNPKAQDPHDLAKIVKHLKPDHQPLLVEGGIPGYELQWTVVRKLVPRNPKLDASLMQTCHLFTSTTPITISYAKEGEEERKEVQELQAERYLIIYLPHVTSPSEIPFYHPTVKALAILYTYIPTSTYPSPLPTQGHLSLHYTLFPTHPLDNRLSRTALNLLQTIHKHSNGRMNGYTKRVHHDVIVPQKTFGDMYAYLKGKYAKELIETWVEQTPAEKHVFEDLGIAAFLIGLWGEMYGGIGEEGDGEDGDEDATETDVEKKLLRAKKNFPGFVDVGCGNGLLVYILNREGWPGTGFDARARKTWDTFPPAISANLSVQLLVPEILNTNPSTSESASPPASAIPLHNGLFPPGTFLIANHADELTIWTPLLATLSSSPFIAIPCCSHTFSGARFRAPNHADPMAGTASKSLAMETGNNDKNKNKNKNKNTGKQPSAYASFCSYMTYLTHVLGWQAEREFLRIPSTRNVAIVGRKRREAEGEDEMKGMGVEEKMEYLRGVVEREMGGVSVEEVRREWLERGSGLMKPGKGG